MSDAKNKSLVLVTILVFSTVLVYGSPQFEEELPVASSGTSGYLSVEEGEETQDEQSFQQSIPYITGHESCQCGTPPERIISGEDADVNQYPWIALLYSVESEKLKIPYCGGALINNQYVLTASHCVDGMSIEKIEVVLGEQNISETSAYATTTLRVGIDKVISHPLYSRRTLDNDIALVKLKVRVPLRKTFPVSPICVPTDDAILSQGLVATVAGYGAISESGWPANNLQKAPVRILSNELCNSAPYHKGKVTPNMVCADGNGKGPCAGDTGGPLMVDISKTASGQVLAGIASWSTTCDDPTRPAVYTRVSRYEAWIRENTADAFWCNN